MGEYYTGAVVTREANLYRVEYKNQIVAKFAILDLAVIFAMDQATLESSLQNSNVINIKIAK